MTEEVKKSDETKDNQGKSLTDILLEHSSGYYGVSLAHLHKDHIVKNSDELNIHTDSQSESEKSMSDNDEYLVKLCQGKVVKNAE